jgi:hypothetical protein
MEPTKKSADSFGTFLKRLNSSATRSDDPGLRLLSVLDESGPATRAELFTRSELDLVSFAAGLEAVRTSGFVSAHGEPGEETLQLTGSGREVVSAAT